MMSMPMRKNCQPVTWRPSRLMAISQRMVASDPVMERLGPRSMEMRTTLASIGWKGMVRRAEPVMSPRGRLLKRSVPKATAAPTEKAA